MRLLGGDGPFADTCAAQITILAQRRTTVLPAALLGLAASGHVCAEMAGLLLCALADGWPPLGSAIVWLCAAGHTCGADLTRGVYIGGWAALAARGGAPGRCHGRQSLAWLPPQLAAGDHGNIDDRDGREESERRGDSRLAHHHQEQRRANRADHQAKDRENQPQRESAARRRSASDARSRVVVVLPGILLAYPRTVIPQHAPLPSPARRSRFPQALRSHARNEIYMPGGMHL